MAHLDGLVPGGGDDLPVVGGEGDGENVLGVVLEAAGGLAGGQVPQPQGLVPGAGQREVTVRGQNHVRDEVAVAVQPLLGDPVVTHVIPGEKNGSRIVQEDHEGHLPGELPDDEALVPGGGQDHVWVLGVGGDLGDPSIVAPQGASQLQRLSHGLADPYFSAKIGGLNEWIVGQPTDPHNYIRFLGATRPTPGRCPSCLP